MQVSNLDSLQVHKTDDDRLVDPNAALTNDPLGSQSIAISDGVLLSGDGASNSSQSAVPGEPIDGPQLNYVLDDGEDLRSTQELLDAFVSHVVPEQLDVETMVSFLIDKLDGLEADELATVQFDRVSVDQLVSYLQPKSHRELGALRLASPVVLDQLANQFSTLQARVAQYQTRVGVSDVAFEPGSIQDVAWTFAQTLATSTVDPNGDFQSFVQAVYGIDEDGQAVAFTLVPLASGEMKLIDPRQDLTGVGLSDLPNVSDVAFVPLFGRTLDGIVVYSHHAPNAQDVTFLTKQVSFQDSTLVFDAPTRWRQVVAGYQSKSRQVAVLADTFQAEPQVAARLGAVSVQSGTQLVREAPREVQKPRQELHLSSSYRADRPLASLSGEARALDIGEAAVQLSNREVLSKDFNQDDYLIKGGDGMTTESGDYRPLASLSGEARALDIGEAAVQLINQEVLSKDFNQDDYLIKGGDGMTTESGDYWSIDEEKLSEWAQELIDMIGIYRSIVMAIFRMFESRRNVVEIIVGAPPSRDKGDGIKDAAQYGSVIQKVLNAVFTELFDNVKAHNNEVYEKEVERIESERSGCANDVDNFLGGGELDKQKENKLAAAEQKVFDVQKQLFSELYTLTFSLNPMRQMAEDFDEVNAADVASFENDFQEAFDSIYQDQDGNEMGLPDGDETKSSERDFLDINTQALAMMRKRLTDMQSMMRLFFMMSLRRLRNMKIVTEELYGRSIGSTDDQTLSNAVEDTISVQNIGFDNFSSTLFKAKEHYNKAINHRIAAEKILKAQGFKILANMVTIAFIAGSIAFPPASALGVAALAAGGAVAAASLHYGGELYAEMTTDQIADLETVFDSQELLAAFLSLVYSIAESQDDARSRFRDAERGSIDQVEAAVDVQNTVERDILLELGHDKMFIEEKDLKLIDYEQLAMIRERLVKAQNIRRLINAMILDMLSARANALSILSGGQISVDAGTYDTIFEAEINLVNNAFRYMVNDLQDIQAISFQKFTLKNNIQKIGVKFAFEIGFSLLGAGLGAYGGKLASKVGGKLASKVGGKVASKVGGKLASKLWVKWLADFSGRAATLASKHVGKLARSKEFRQQVVWGMKPVGAGLGSIVANEALPSSWMHVDPTNDAQYYKLLRKISEKKTEANLDEKLDLLEQRDLEAKLLIMSLYQESEGLQVTGKPLGGLESTQRMSVNYKKVNEIVNQLKDIAIFRQLIASVIHMKTVGMQEALSVIAGARFSTNIGRMGERIASVSNGLMFQQLGDVVSYLGQVASIRNRQAAVRTETVRSSISLAVNVAMLGAGAMYTQYAQFFMMASLIVDPMINIAFYGSQAREDFGESGHISGADVEKTDSESFEAREKAAFDSFNDDSISSHEGGRKALNAENLTNAMRSLDLFLKHRQLIASMRQAMLHQMRKFSSIVAGAPIYEMMSVGTGEAGMRAQARRSQLNYAFSNLREKVVRYNDIVSMRQKAIEQSFEFALRAVSAGVRLHSVKASQGAANPAVGKTTGVASETRGHRIRMRFLASWDTIQIVLRQLTDLIAFGIVEASESSKTRSIKKAEKPHEIASDSGLMGLEESLSLSSLDYNIKSDIAQLRVEQIQIKNQLWQLLAKLVQDLVMEKQSGSILFSKLFIGAANLAFFFQNKGLATRLAVNSLPFVKPKLPSEKQIKSIKLKGVSLDKQATLIPSITRTIVDVQMANQMSNSAQDLNAMKASHASLTEALGRKFAQNAHQSLKSVIRPKRVQRVIGKARADKDALTQKLIEVGFDDQLLSGLSGLMDKAVDAAEGHGVRMGYIGQVRTVLTEVESKLSTSTNLTDRSQISQLIANVRAHFQELEMVTSAQSAIEKLSSASEASDNPLSLMELSQLSEEAMSKVSKYVEFVHQKHLFGRGIYKAFKPTQQRVSILAQAVAQAQAAETLMNLAAIQAVGGRAEDKKSANDKIVNRMLEGGLFGDLKQLNAIAADRSVSDLVFGRFDRSISGVVKYEKFFLKKLIANTLTAIEAADDANKDKLYETFAKQIAQSMSSPVAARPIAESLALLTADGPRVIPLLAALQAIQTSEEMVSASSIRSVTIDQVSTLRQDKWAIIAALNKMPSVEEVFEKIKPLWEASDQDKSESQFKNKLKRMGKSLGLSDSAQDVLIKQVLTPKVTEVPVTKSSVNVASEQWSFHYVLGSIFEKLRTCWEPNSVMPESPERGALNQQEQTKNAAVQRAAQLIVNAQFAPAVLKLKQDQIDGLRTKLNLDSEDMGEFVECPVDALDMVMKLSRKSEVSPAVVIHQLTQQSSGKQLQPLTLPSLVSAGLMQVMRGDEQVSYKTLVEEANAAKKSVAEHIVSLASDHEVQFKPKGDEQEVMAQLSRRVTAKEPILDERALSAARYRKTNPSIKRHLEDALLEIRPGPNFAKRLRAIESKFQITESQLTAALHKATGGQKLTLEQGFVKVKDTGKMESVAEALVQSVQATQSKQIQSLLMQQSELSSKAGLLARVMSSHDQFRKLTRPAADNLSKSLMDDTTEKRDVNQRALGFLSAGQSEHKSRPPYPTCRNPRFVDLGTVQPSVVSQEVRAQLIDQARLVLDHDLKSLELTEESLEHHRQLIELLPPRLIQSLYLPTLSAQNGLSSALRNKVLRCLPDERRDVLQVALAKTFPNDLGVCEPAVNQLKTKLGLDQSTIKDLINMPANKQLNGEQMTQLGNLVNQVAQKGGPNSLLFLLRLMDTQGMQPSKASRSVSSRLKERLTRFPGGKIKWGETDFDKLAASFLVSADEDVAPKVALALAMNQPDTLAKIGAKRLGAQALGQLMGKAVESAFETSGDGMVSITTPQGEEVKTHVFELVRNVAKSIQETQQAISKSNTQARSFLFAVMQTEIGTDETVANRVADYVVDAYNCNLGDDVIKSMEKTARMDVMMDFLMTLEQPRLVERRRADVLGSTSPKQVSSEVILSKLITRLKEADANDVAALLLDMTYKRSQISGPHSWRVLPGSARWDQWVLQCIQHDKPELGTSVQQKLDDFVVRALKPGDFVDQQCDSTVQIFSPPDNSRLIESDDGFLSYLDNE